MKEGSVYAGRYRVKKRIGRGGMSRVYLAEVLCDGTFAVLKQECTPAEGRALLREYHYLKELEHGGIPKVREYLKDPEGDVLVMDYVEGEDLKQRLNREGAFSEEQVRAWGIALCCILIYLHTRKIPLWHLDIKPSNVMVRKEGGLVLLDFGAAMQAGERVMWALGTKGYASPEQQRRQELSAASDIYSLGATLYHLWTGRLYEGATLEREGFLEGILSRCLEEDPCKRYRSGEELLRELLQGKAGRPCRRMTSFRKVGVVGVCCLLMWSVFGWLSFQRETKAEQVRQELENLSDSENLCLLFPEKRQGYCLYLEDAVADGKMEPWEEAGFLELCGRIPLREEETCLTILHSEEEEYEAVRRLAVEMGMAYGSWDFAEIFLAEEETWEWDLIQFRRKLLEGKTAGFAEYWERLIRWRERMPEAALRVLREAGTFFGGFRKSGMEEELRKFWESEREYASTAEWNLLQEMLEAVR